MLLRNYSFALSFEGLDEYKRDVLLSTEAFGQTPFLNLCHKQHLLLLVTESLMNIHFERITSARQHITICDLT